MELPRVGLDIPDKRTAATAIDSIMRAETRGVPMMWSTVGRFRPDAVTFFAAALARTSTVQVGTAIVPTYPRHPYALYSQALALHQIAPERFRLGIGPSHRPTIVDSYGIPFGKPLDHLREYLTVLRTLLETGEARFEGEYFSVNIASGGTAPVPLYISALRSNAFRLAGELADGAISWLCPIHYLLESAVPSMRAGADVAGRAMPRMIAHVPVMMTTDPAKMREYARPDVSRYGRLPFYANMFADAGYPVAEDGTATDALLDHLVVSGDRETVKTRLAEILESEIDELLVMLIPGEDPAGEEVAISNIISELAT